MNQENRWQPLDLESVQATPIRERKNIVSRNQFRPPCSPDASFEEWLDSLPSILAADELKAAVEAVFASREANAPVVAALGGHVVKVGMGPILIDLMERGFIHAIAMNGATAIHDLELAMIGETSEDVATHIADGSFGMSAETAEAFREAATSGAKDEGLGAALGELILRQEMPHREISMLASARRLGIPATVHVAFGTDIVHMHPGVAGADMGAATAIDFQLLAAVVHDLEKGCWLNIGSAVVMPEVFLKVVNIARNLGQELAGVTAINFDMIPHYRTSRNVLQRPVERGISLIGHHEINLPLFRMALLQRSLKEAR
ncbi:MAG: hypothetical protein CBC13_05145 [Planctomycetia bacterium TMED53]|nr:MAG: hypothetical protein CBC13_05145 [Planctomycetia bacterium TMED53]